MPYLNEIVQEINDSFNEGILKHVPFNIKLNGISELIPTIEGDAVSSFPALYDQFGDGEFSGIDDRYNLVMYHRCLSRSYAPDTNNFGSGYDNYIETNNMLMVVWADRKNLHLSKEQIQDKIVVGLPTTLTQELSVYSGMGDVDIIAADINGDAQSVWSQEFAGYEYKLDTSQVLFTLSYSVEVKFRKSCVSECKDC